MNKWHLSSRRLFINSLVLLPIGIISVPLYVFCFGHIIYDLIYTPSGDLIAILILLLVVFPVWLFGSIIICAHIHIGFSVYKLTPNGVIMGFLKKELIHWDDVVFCERLPFAVGRLQSYYGFKKDVIFLFPMGDRNYDYVAYSKQYGVSTLLLFQEFGFLGKLGLLIVKFWIECMQQNIEVSYVAVPIKAIWFEYDDNIVSIMRRYAQTV